VPHCVSVCAVLVAAVRSSSLSSFLFFFLIRRSAARKHKKRKPGDPVHCYVIATEQCRNPPTTCLANDVVTAPSKKEPRARSPSPSKGESATSEKEDAAHMAVHSVLSPIPY